MVPEHVNFHELSRLGKSVRFCQNILFLSFVLIQFIALILLFFYILICKIFISANISKRVLYVSVFMQRIVLC